ncbi:MAG TPA: DUF6543 domain-containing protein [Luteibacter sp.]|uniref:dermonecrotic toxin domain-containing protein n=1 Tax=Luteibacter sp. TaxID=1886636 RepID=UPI002BDEAF6D|nr:DUF6543 domain-containing protein [Luteibacter sp.]HVI56530.1 DUF6543 domain-containing protein [Luteibacter sp.]
METTPPQAPPAIVSSTQQETVDALGRLVAVQAWLRAQHRDMPALPARPTVEGREAWLASLDAFWQQSVQDEPGTGPIPRTDALATRLASAMRDDAIVRRLDGTLDPAAANLAERFARSLGGDLPPGMEARTLRIGRVDYAGAVILLDRNDPALAVLFMPDRGWDAFEGIERLHAQTEARLRELLARRRELPGIRADDTERVVANDRFVDSSPLQANVFHVMAQRMTALQREKVEDAWLSPDETTDTTERLADDTMWALDLHDKLDISSMLVEREGRLAVNLSEQRLARVPAHVAQDWRKAMEGYRLARLMASAWTRHHVDEAPLTLAAWSRQELGTALSRRRIEVDPDDIQIEASGNEGITVPTGGATPATPPVRMSLAEFALRNTGYYDERRLRVVTAGSRTGPSVHAVREITRELDLARRFASYLRDRVSDPQGRRFRNMVMRVQHARMRLEATAARMAAYLPEETAAFADDREERGYRMVEAVLDSPAASSRGTVGNHRIGVRQLTYRGAAVSDVLVIGVRDARSSPRVVLYTPGAPDGRPFREFSDRATAAREFLYAPAFQEYLLRRLPAEYGEPLPNGGGRRFRVADATRRAHWVLGASGDGRGTITEEPFAEILVDGDVRTALFDAEIVRQARDVAWLGRSTAQADTEITVGIIHGALHGLGGPAGVVEDTLGAVGQALRATWRFYDSVKAGDNGQAFVDFTEAYTASLALAGWGTGASRATRTRLSLRPAGNATRPVSAGSFLPDARRWLDPRYAVRDIDLGATRPDALGIHRLNGRRYIRQQELVFELRYDPSFDTWRLVRPDAMDATFAAAAVEPARYGGWRLRTDVGLRGGWVDDAAFPQHRSRSITGAGLEALSVFQSWTFQQSLAARLRNGREAVRLYWEVTSQPYPRFVTLRQHTAWNDALRTARSTPREPLSIGSQPGPGASWRVLPVDEWPAQLWHYPQGRGLAVGGGSELVLPLQALPGSGLTGLPVSTQAPVGVEGPRWIRLNTDRFRNRRGTPESPGLRIIEDRRSGEPSYVVQPAVGFPISFLGLEAGDFAAGGRASP